MSRLNTENFLNVGSPSRARSTANPLDLFAPDADSFGRHLQQAFDQSDSSDRASNAAQRQSTTSGTKPDSPSDRTETSRRKDKPSARDDAGRTDCTDDHRDDASDDVAAKDSNEATCGKIDSGNNASSNDDSEASSDSQASVKEAQDGAAQSDSQDDPSENHAEDAAAVVMIAQLSATVTPAEQVAAESASAVAEVQAAVVESTDQEPAGDMPAKGTAVDTSAVEAPIDSEAILKESAGSSAEDPASVGVDGAESSQSAEDGIPIPSEVAEDATARPEGDEQQRAPTATEARSQTESVAAATDAASANAKDSDKNDHHGSKGDQRDGDKRTTGVEKSKPAVTTPHPDAAADAAAQTTPAVSLDAVSADSTASSNVNQAAAVQPSATSGNVSTDSRVAAQAGNASDNEPVDTTDRAKFVQRVSRAFGSASQQNETIRMRLHPDELGSIRLEMTMRQGVLSARIETDTPEAKNLLLDNLPALRERLAQQDIKIERFEVDYQSGDGRGAPPGTDDGRQSSGGSRQGPGNAPNPRPTQTAAPAAVRRAAAPGQGSQLDLLV